MRRCWRGVLRRSYRCCPGRREVHVGALPSSSNAHEQPRWTAGTLHTALTLLLADEPDTRRTSSRPAQPTLPSLPSYRASSQPIVKAEGSASPREPSTASPLSSSRVHVSIRELKDEGTLLRRLLLARRRATRARRAQLESDKARSIAGTTAQHPNRLDVHTLPSTTHTLSYSSSSTSVVAWQRAYVLFVDAVQRDAVLPTTQHINLLLQLALRAQAWHIVDQLADFHARFLHAVRRLQREREREKTSQSIGEAGTRVPHAEGPVKADEESSSSDRASVVLYHDSDAPQDIQRVATVHRNNSSSNSMSQEVMELRHMESMLQPNTRTYAVLMQAALCRRQWQSVLDLYEDMCMVMDSTSNALYSTVHMTDTVLRYVLQAYAHRQPDVTSSTTSPAHLAETSASWQAAYVLYLRYQTLVHDVRTLHGMLQLLHDAQAPAHLTVELYEAHGSSSLCTCATDKSDRCVAALCAVWCLTSTAAAAAATYRQDNWSLTLRILRQACCAARLDGRIGLNTLHVLLETALMALHQAKRERCIVQLFHRASLQCEGAEREMSEAPVPLLWSSRAYTLLAQAAVVTNDADLLLTLCRGGEEEEEQENTNTTGTQLSDGVSRARLPTMPEAVYDAALQVLQHHSMTQGQQQQQLMTRKSVLRDWPALAHMVYTYYKQQTRYRPCSAVHTPLLMLLNEASRTQPRSYDALARVLAQIRRPDRLVIALAAECIAKRSQTEAAAAVSEMACKVVHMALQTCIAHDEASTRKSKSWLSLIISVAASLSAQDTNVEHALTCVAVEQLVNALSHCAPFAALVLLRLATELHTINRDAQETHRAHEEAWAAALAIAHTRLARFVQAHSSLGVSLRQLYAAWQDDAVTQAILGIDTSACTGVQCSRLVHVVFCTLHAVQMYSSEAEGEAAALHAMRELHTCVQQQQQQYSYTNGEGKSDALVARIVALVVQQVVLYASDSVALMQSCLGLLRSCASDADTYVLRAAYILAVMCTSSSVGSALLPALHDLCMSSLPGGVCITRATTQCVSEEMRGAALHLALQVMQVCSEHLPGHTLYLTSLHERVSDVLRDLLLPRHTHAAHERTSSTLAQVQRHALHAELTVMCALTAAMQPSAPSGATPQTAAHLVTLFISALHQVRALLAQNKSSNNDDGGEGGGGDGDGGETAWAELRELGRRCHTHYDAMVSLPDMHTALVDIPELCVQHIQGNTSSNDDDAQEVEYLHEVIWPLLEQLSTTACTSTAASYCSSVTSHAVVARLQHIAQQLLLCVRRQSVAVHVAELWCVLTARTLLPAPPSPRVYERAVLSCGQAVLTVLGGVGEGKGLAVQGSRTNTTACVSLSLLLTAIDELTQQQQQQQQYRAECTTRQKNDAPRGVYALQPWQLRVWHEAAVRLLYMTCCECDACSTQPYNNSNSSSESMMSWLVRCLPWPCEAGLQRSILERVVQGGTATQLTSVLRGMQAILQYYNHPYHDNRNDDAVNRELYMSCTAHALRLVQRLMQATGNNHNNRAVPLVLRNETLGAEALLCLAMLSHSTTPSHLTIIVSLCMTLLQTFPHVVAQHVLPRWHRGLLSAAQHAGLTHLMHTFVQPPSLSSSSMSCTNSMCDGGAVPYAVRRAAMTWLLVSQGSIHRKRNTECSIHTPDVNDRVTPFTRLMTLAAPAQAADDVQAQLRHIAQTAVLHDEHMDNVAEDITRTAANTTSMSAVQQLAEVMTRTTALLVLQHCFPAQLHTRQTGSPVLPHVAPAELSVLLQLTTRHLQPGQAQEIARCNASRTPHYTLLHILQHRPWQVCSKTAVQEMLSGELLLRLAQCVLARAEESSNNNNNSESEADTHDMTAAELLLQGVLGTSVKHTSWQALYECISKDKGDSVVVCDVPEACRLPGQYWPAVLTAVEQWLLRRTLTALHSTPHTTSVAAAMHEEVHEEEGYMWHVCLACLARRDRGRATRFVLTTLYPRVLQPFMSSLHTSATQRNASHDDDDVVTRVASFVHEYIVPLVRHAMQEEQSEAQDREERELLLFSAVRRVCSDATLVELLVCQQYPHDVPQGPVRRQPSKAERAALHTLQSDAQELVQLLSRRCLAWCDAHTAKRLKKKEEGKDKEDVQSITHGDVVYLSAWAQSVVLTGQWQEAHWLARQLILRIHSNSNSVCTPLACDATHWLRSLVVQLLPVLLCASLRTRNTRAQECLQLLDDLTCIVPESEELLCAMRRLVHGAAAALRGRSERLIRRFTQDAGRAPAYGERLLLVCPVLHVLHAAREAADTSCATIMQLLLCGSEADQAAWEQCYVTTQQHTDCCTSAEETLQLTREVVHEAFEVLRRASAAQWQAFLRAEAQPIVRGRRNTSLLPMCTKACTPHEAQNKETDDVVGHAWRVLQMAVLSYHEHSPALFAPSALRALLLQLPLCLPHTPHFISPAMTELLVCASCADWREAMALLRHSVAAVRQTQRAQRTLEYCRGPVQEYMVVLLLRRVRRSRKGSGDERRFCDGLADLCYTFTPHSALTVKNDAHVVKDTTNVRYKEREDSGGGGGVREDETASSPHAVRGEVALVCSCLDLLCSSHISATSSHQTRRKLPQYVLTELLRHAVYDTAVVLALYELFWSQRYTRLEAGQVFLSLLRAARLAGRQDMALRAMQDMLACCTAASHTHHCTSSSSSDGSSYPVLAQRHVHAVWLAFVQLCQMGVVSALHASAVQAAYERQGNLLSEVDLLLLGPH